MIKLAEKTRDLNVEYFVIGEGVMKPYVEEKKKELNLEKLHVLPYQPRNLMPAILAYSDVQFIFMTPQMEGQGFPSKVYTIMACGRALLIGSGQNTPIVNFLEPVGCAKLVYSHDVEAKTDEMAQWLASVTRDELRAMGAMGEKTILEGYTKEIVTQKYVDLIDKLLK